MCVPNVQIYKIDGATARFNVRFPIRNPRNKQYRLQHFQHFRQICCYISILMVNTSDLDQQIYIRVAVMRERMLASYLQSNLYIRKEYTLIFPLKCYTFEHTVIAV